MGLTFVPIWKEAPFIRLLVPLIAGIICEYFLHIGSMLFWGAAIMSISGIFQFSVFRLSLQFRYALVYGLLIHLLLFSVGGLLASDRDTSERRTAVAEAFSPGTIFIASLKEPPATKPRSLKAECALLSIQYEDSCFDPATNIIVYFRKDSTASPPVYGERIAFSKSPERIKNIPGSATFDYVKYCGMRNIYYQVFLSNREYVKLSDKNTNSLSLCLFAVQDRIINALQKYIAGKKECGLAEALLIGYKNDLDKELIQSYSSTGVVHVVAISGLHLGLIYALLKYVCIPLRKIKWGKRCSPPVIISGLWLFSLLAGASPSVLRSAVMFSFIVAGESLSRKTSIFNNLAASAFFLLCYDPYWLWDTGFQLSYAALISIVLFMKPIYHLILFKNKIADMVWKLNSVTLSAQILTLPVCLYYFHQFPTLFLITNFIAVPLSSIILMGEIALCALSSISVLATPLGWMLSMLLKLMNRSVELMGSFPFSTITGLDISFLQVLMLYCFIAAMGAWLIGKSRAALPVGLVAGILFMADSLI